MLVITWSVLFTFTFFVCFFSHQVEMFASNVQFYASAQIWIQQLWLGGSPAETSGPSRDAGAEEQKWVVALYFFFLHWICSCSCCQPFIPHSIIIPASTHIRVTFHLLHDLDLSLPLCCSVVPARYLLPTSHLAAFFPADSCVQRLLLSELFLPFACDSCVYSWPSSGH